MQCSVEGDDGAVAGGWVVEKGRGMDGASLPLLVQQKQESLNSGQELCVLGGWCGYPQGALGMELIMTGSAKGDVVLVCGDSRGSGSDGGEGFQPRQGKRVSTMTTSTTSNCEHRKQNKAIKTNNSKWNRNQNINRCQRFKPPLRPHPFSQG